MAREESPAFQFYVKEWRGSRVVFRMTAAQRGMYLEMLLEQWENLSLPDDPMAVCEIIGFSPAEWKRNWEILRRNFVTSEEGRIVNLRLEKERVKQKIRREKGLKGGLRRRDDVRDSGGKFQPSTSPAPAQAPAYDQPSDQPSTSPATSPTPTSDQPSDHVSTSPATTYPPALHLHLQVADRSLQVAGASDPPTARSKKPVFVGQKLTIFEWMLDDCLKTLGTLGSEFDLHEWFFALDAKAVNANLVIPKRDGGAWLQSQLVAEAQRRGLPLQMATAEPQNKRIAGLVAGGNAFLNRGQR